MLRPSTERGDSAADPEKTALWLLWPIIVAGEAIFLLPFVLPRLFRPSILEAWQISHRKHSPDLCNPPEHAMVRLTDDFRHHRISHL